MSMQRWIVVVVAWGTAVSSAAGGSPPRGLPVVKPTKLINVGKTISWKPQYVFRPGRDIDELSRILRWVHTELPPTTKIKAGGSRGSWTRIANTDGVYILPQGMSFVSKVQPRDVRAGVDVRYLFRVGAGTILRKVNDALWAAGAALPTLPGFDKLTVAGTFMTGSHASVLSQGPLPDMARSLDMVKADGTKVRVEPKDGITAAAAFARSHPGWQLIQDDDTFAAALINMGTMGVVHSYVIQARARFWLREIRTKTTGRRAEKLLKGGGIYRLGQNPKAPARAHGFKGHPAPAYYLEMLWNPHSDKLIVTTRHPVGKALRARYLRHEPKTFRDPPRRGGFRSIFLDRRYRRSITPKLMGIAGKGTLSVVQLGSKLVPKLMSKTVDAALDTMTDKNYTQRSYNVFGYPEAVSQISGQATTLVVPLRDDLYLKAIDIMRRTARSFAKRGVYQSGAISWRFVKGSRAILAAPEDVAEFEIIFSGSDKSARKLAEKMALGYYRAVERALGADVRFHWGHRIPAKAIPTYRKHLPQAFPRYRKFLQIRKAFDPREQFLTPWQEYLLLGRALVRGPRVAKAKLSAWDKLKKGAAKAAVWASRKATGILPKKLYDKIANREYHNQPDTAKYPLRAENVLTPPSRAPGMVPSTLPQRAPRGRVDLTRGFGGVRYQGHRDTAVAFAALAAMEYALKNRPGDLSEQYAYWLFKNAERGKARCRGGAKLFAAARLLHEHGVPVEGKWKYQSANLARVFQSNCFKKETWSSGKPPRAAARADKYVIRSYSVIANPADPAALMAVLDAGYPVVFATGVAGSHWKAWTMTTKVIDIPVDKKRKPLAAKSSHTILLVGYNRAKQAFRFRNSRGYRWGKKGYHWLSFDYVRQYARGAWYVRAAGKK